MAATQHDTTLIELNIIHVKPKYIFHMMSHTQEALKLLQKFGVKVLATWMSEAGATSQLYMMVSYASYAAREKFMLEHMIDPEWVKYHTKVMKFIYESEQFICKANPHVPMKTIDPKKKYLVQMLKYHDFPPFSNTKIWESTVEAEKVIGPHAARAVAMLHPMLTSHSWLIMIRELPDEHIDESLNAYVDAIKDPKNWAHMYDISRHVSRERNVLVRTPPFDKLPKME